MCWGFWACVSVSELHSSPRQIPGPCVHLSSLLPPWAGHLSLSQISCSLTLNLFLCFLPRSLQTHLFHRYLSRGPLSTHPSIVPSIHGTQSKGLLCARYCGYSGTRQQCPQPQEASAWDPAKTPLASILSQSIFFTQSLSYDVPSRTFSALWAQN